jgi:hypothetical protein
MFVSRNNIKMKVAIQFLGKQHILEINKSHYMRRLGFPKDYELPEQAQENIDWSAQWYSENGTPWLHIYELPVGLENGKLSLNNTFTEAPKVYKRFEKHQVKKAMLIAATAGEKVDLESTELWSSDTPDKAFFLETYASCVTESLVEFAVDSIKSWAEKKQEHALARYSPGYPGWELSEQQTLMKIIKEVSEELPITISETSLLQPLKSQISLVGIHKIKELSQKSEIKIECMECIFNDCACSKKESYIKI